MTHLTFSGIDLRVTGRWIGRHEDHLPKARGPQTVRVEAPPSAVRCCVNSRRWMCVNFKPDLLDVGSQDLNNDDNNKTQMTNGPSYGYIIYYNIYIYSPIGLLSFQEA